MTNATATNIAKLQTVTRLGYYAIARHPEGGFGVIWSEVRPNRASYWTGETHPTQDGALAVCSARMESMPPVPPTGALKPVVPIDALRSKP